MQIILNKKEKEALQLICSFDRVKINTEIINKLIPYDKELKILSKLKLIDLDYIDYPSLLSPCNIITEIGRKILLENKKISNYYDSY